MLDQTNLRPWISTIVFACLLISTPLHGQTPTNDSPCWTDTNPPLDLTGIMSAEGTTCEATFDLENIDCSSTTESASVWYVFTPNEEDEGYDIEFQGASIDGNVTVEVYKGSLDSGCVGFGSTIASSCSNQSVFFQIPNCTTTNEIFYIKVATGDTTNDCGEFNITISPASCDGDFVVDDCIDITEFIGTTFTPEECDEAPIYFDFTGCISYACPEEQISSCTAGENPTVWVQVQVDDLAAQMLVNIQPNGPWEADWAVYAGSCDDPILVSGYDIDCASGSPAQNLQVPIVFAPDGTPLYSTYYVAITAIGYEPGMDGSFTGAVATIQNCISCIGFNTDEDGSYVTGCNTTANFEVTDRSSDRALDDLTFCQGEEVTICIDFYYDASQTGIDWLHGMIPNFGSGWDLQNFDPAQVASETGSEWAESGGECAPYLTEQMPFLCTYTDENGVLQICNTLCDASCPCESPAPANTPLPSGWFWNQPGGLATCTGECTPSDNWGIGSTTSQINFCVDLKVKEFDTEEGCLQNNSLQFFFQTTSDGVTGCWEDKLAECLLDGAQYSPEYRIECKSLPTAIAVDEELCIEGVLDVLVQTDDGSTTEIIVAPVPNDNITGANSYIFEGGSGVITDELINISNEEQIQNYILTTNDLSNPCNSESTILKVTIATEFEAFIPTTAICESDCVELYVDMNGCGKPPYQYLWSTGQVTETIEVCPSVATTYVVTITDIMGLETILETVVEVNPILNVILPESISVCKDDNFDPDNPDYLVCLELLSGSSPFNVEWEPQIGLAGQSTGSFGECFMINEVLSSEFLGTPGGVYTLTANVTDFFGCEGTAEMEVSVTGELAIIANVTPYACEETNVSMNVTGLDAAGNPLTTFLLYGGCPDDGLGPFLDDYNTNSGTLLIDNLDLQTYTCYTVVGLTATGCQTSIDIEIPILEEIPIELNFDSNICEGSTAFISVTNADDFISFEWSSELGFSESVSFIPDSTETYTLTATTVTGCIETASFTITVHPIESLYCTDPCEAQEVDYQIVGSAYSDINKNGVLDMGDVPLSNVMISDNANGFTTFTNILGQYVIPVSPGINNLTASNSAGVWEASMIDINGIDVTEPCTEGINFGFIPTDGVPEAKITVTNSITRCNWETRFYVTVENVDHDPIDGEVEFTFDEETTFFSSEIPNTQVNGNTLKFSTGIIDAFGQKTFIFRLKMPTGTASLPLLDFNAKLFQNDELLDEYEYSQQLLCSYDPNDKRTYPDREGDENQTLVGETIDYTIRFQNNGNDTAFFVQIVDILDSYVDKTSIRFNSSSHPYYACLMGDTLVLDFIDIRLVDSMTNYPGSQGYVNFSLDVDKSIPEGTIIYNTANIIFDSNDPIVTNTVLNTIVYDFCTDPMTNLYAEICNGEDYLGYTETGMYQDTIITEEGCDSILNIELLVIPVEEIDLEYTICQGEQIEYDGSTYTFEKSGLFVVEIGGLSGCIEKKLFFNISLIPTQYPEDEVVTICMDEDYEGLNSTGVYSIEDLDPNTNCPIVRTIYLTVIPVEEIGLNFSICEGEVIEYQNNVYIFEESGLYTENIIGESGCIETKLLLDVEVIFTIYLDIEDVTICEDEDYEGLDSTGVYQIDMIDPDTNCPVVRTINLTVLPLTDEACTTSTSNISKGDILIYPNPTQDILTISSAYQISSVQVYNSTGFRIYNSQSIDAFTSEVDLNLNPSGLYLIQLETEQGIWIEKVVKR